MPEKIDVDSGNPWRDPVTKEFASPDGADSAKKTEGFSLEDIEDMLSDFDEKAYTVEDIEAMLEDFNEEDYGDLIPQESIDEIAKKINTLRNYLVNRKKRIAARKPELTPEQAIRFNKKMKEILSKAEAGARTKLGSLIAILKSDSYKNQFEVGSSEGLYSPSTRKRVSNILFGTDENDMIRDSDTYKMEKYGMLLDSGRGITNTLNGRMGSGYGECLILFDKDKLKGQITYSIGDSLDYRSYDNAPQRIDDDVLDEYVSPAEWSFSKAIKNFENWNNIYDIYKANGESDGYIEAQYHVDNLKISTYAKAIVIPQELLSMTWNAKQAKEAIKLAKNLGVKVYVSGMKGTLPKRVDLNENDEFEYFEDYE